MRFQVLVVLIAVAILPSCRANLGSIKSALEAFSCGCGCRFEDVGTCETRYATECEKTYNKKCIKTSKPSCSMVPTTNCKTIYHEKCTKQKKCSTSHTQQCKNVPQKNCKQVVDEKCHQIPKKSCQTVTETKCKKIPKQQCKTVYNKQCTKIPQKNCKNEQKCKTTYEQKCKPSYGYKPKCESVPKQQCWNEKKCSTSYTNSCKDVPSKKCETTYQQKCENIPNKKCTTTYERKCEKIPKQLCLTSQKKECWNVPHNNCKDVKNCVKIPEKKCWQSQELKCKSLPQQSCFNAPKLNCWNVSLKKNRYVKKKVCQKCQRHEEKYNTKNKRKKCNFVPREDCRTIYVNKCNKVPYQDCKTVYKNRCWQEEKCKTTYQTKCEKPKPSYGAPQQSYGAPSYNAPKCKDVPVKNCWKEKKCAKEPQQQCGTKYRNNCNKVPQQKCSKKLELKCNDYTVDVPKTRVKFTCHWPSKQQDRFCTKRSDYDRLLDAADDFSNDMEYMGREIDDEVDYLEVFPIDYTGSPNETITEDGEKIFPQPSAVPPTLNAIPEPAENLQSDIGNLDFTKTSAFPKMHNTSGVIRQVDAPKSTASNSDNAGYFPLNAKTQDGYSTDGAMVGRITYSGGDQSTQQPPPSPPQLSSFDASKDFGSTNLGFFPDNFADVFKSQISRGFSESPGQNIWKRNGETQPQNDMTARSYELSPERATSFQDTFRQSTIREENRPFRARYGQPSNGNFPAFKEIPSKTKYMTPNDNAQPSNTNFHSPYAQPLNSFHLEPNHAMKEFESNFESTQDFAAKLLKVSPESRTSFETKFAKTSDSRSNFAANSKRSPAQPVPSPIQSPSFESNFDGSPEGFWEWGQKLA